MMQTRLISQYVYAFVAGSSLFVGFTASVSQTIAAPASRPMFAVSQYDQTPVPNAVMLSWLGFLGTLLAIAGKSYTDLRNRKRDGDIADVKAMGQEVTQARAELGDALSDLKAQARELADLKVTKEARLARIIELETQNKSQAARISSQSARVAELESNMAKITASQQAVVQSVNKQQKRTKATETRMAEIENTVGSSSNLNLTVTPPAEDSTTLDLPTIQ